MAPRPVWKGQLRLSLVSIPIELYTATKTASKISFRQIHEPSGKPVSYQKTVAGIGPIDTADIVKGYETDDGEYVLIDPDEVDAIKLETKKTLELVQFVGSCEIPPLYFDKPYYVTPTDELAQDAYRVVRDALRQSEKVGLGQLSMRGKEYLVAIKPCGDGLLLETLHYAEEIRNAEPIFSEIKDEKIDDDLLDVATTLIDRKTAPFDASSFTDNYADALRELVEAKVSDKKGARVPVKDGETTSSGKGGDNVVDLMAALKASLDKADDTKSKKSSGSSSKSKPSSSRSRKKAS
ncbi:Ku protein [Notoacmeibacter sp. MSK16QG-6]|uniref:non-homologous end joining protein Ku n=1 Tax=Notoacmeibacter sp. MSK16QG-6 TaxID=2957982 RepID=UPI0020A158D7|nr:Ku protein [Notoacmeibacter sp. MSK16QG-6]MCP1200875.1 Ku protein [Notoacmeibacter sp. MSK16QG-6]